MGAFPYLTVGVRVRQRRRANETMTPTEFEAVSNAATADELLDILTASYHGRVPL